MEQEKFVKRLIGMKAELRERLEKMEGHIQRRDAPLSADFSEQAVERQNDDVVFALDDTLNSELQQIDAALRRIEAGDFGTCVACGGEIEAARLEAIPFADKCVDCKT